MRNILRISSLVWISISGTGCVTDNPVSENYYEDTSKIKGGYAPSVPTLSFDKTTWTISYTQSVDPDTGSEVPYYYFYVYAGYPTEYYKFYDIALRRETGATKSFVIDPITQSGIYTVIVTGYDLARESAITSQNNIHIIVP